MVIYKSGGDFMKKLLMFLIIILLACPLYAQTELDQDAANGIDHEWGGTGKTSWAVGEIPYCSVVTGDAGTGTGNLAAMGEYSYQTDHIRVADNETFCFGDSDDMCITYSSSNNRLEFTTALAAYFTGSIITAPSATPRMTFYDSQCAGADKEIGYIGMNAETVTESSETGDIFLYSKGGADSEVEQLRFDQANGRWETTNDLLGGVYAVEKGSTYTIGADDAKEAYGGIFVNTTASTRTYTLPSAVPGMHVCVMNGNGISNILVLQSAASDVIVLDGAPTGAGEFIDSAGAAGDYVCVFALDDTDWYTKDKNGTWSVE